MKTITKREVRDYLESRIRQDRFQKLSDLPDPFLFEDMEKATQRIKKAIESDELITVVGDYDVDGVISTSIISDFFSRLGIRHEAVIPDRFADGYGFSETVLQKCSGTLIITVDNGITAHEAARICQESSIDLIITDHHEPKETLPKSLAIINPKKTSCTFPYDQICGAQVTWYLCAALKIKMGYDINLSSYIELLALAIVADVMPLQEINRSLVKAGLKQMTSSRRPALQVLKTMLDRQHFTSEDLSFSIIPRLNAAGRMGNADIAKAFIMGRDFQESLHYFQQLDTLNSERKIIEQEVTLLAQSQVESSDSIIVVWGEGWHEGTIGIVASRLSEQYQKPAIVFSVMEESAKGSARSYGELDILSLIETQSPLLEGFGGHKGAAGINIRPDRLPSFKQQINLTLSSSDSRYDSDSADSDIIGILPYKEIDSELLEILESYEPYGEAAPKPRFVSENSTIQECRIVGKETRHTSFLLQDSDSSTHLKAIAFRQEHLLKSGQQIDFSFTVSRNTFQKKSSPQLIISHIFKSA